jgi:hypothetical protein
MDRLHLAQAIKCGLPGILAVMTRYFEKRVPFGLLRARLEVVSFITSAGKDSYSNLRTVLQKAQEVGHEQNRLRDTGPVDRCVKRRSLLSSGT